jgi:hypothetical protein
MPNTTARKSLDQIRLAAALADGQIADDSLLIHNSAVDWDANDLAAHKLDQYARSIGYLYDQAIADAAAAGVKLDIATNVPGPRCDAHPYYLHQSHGGYGCPLHS